MQDYIKNLGGNSFLDSYSSTVKKKTTPQVSPILQQFMAPSLKINPSLPTSNPGATATTPKPITPPSSPAKSAFINSVANTPANYTNPNASYQDVTGGAPGTTVTPQSQTPQAPVVDPKQGYKDAYAKYIESLSPSEEETKATKRLNDLNLQSDKDYETALDRGETLGFASGEAARVNKNNSFGIRAASDALSAITGARTATTNAAKARTEFEKGLLPKDEEAYTLSEGQTRYGPDGKAIASVPKSASGSSSDGFTLSPGEVRYDATGKLIASGGPKPPTQAQETAAIAKTEKEQAAQQSATQSIGLVNDLLSGGVGAITGIGQNPLNALGLTNQKTINQYNQLQGLLKLGVRSLIKGTGSISDYESKILGEAASALGRNLSNAAFEQELRKIRGVLQTNNGGETQVVVRDKNGKVLGQGMLTGQDIYEAVNDGATVEYL